MKKNHPELLYTLNDFRVTDKEKGYGIVIMPNVVRQIARKAGIKLVKGRKHPQGSLQWGIRKMDGPQTDWIKWLSASPFTHEEVNGEWCLVRRRVKPWPKVD